MSYTKTAYLDFGKLGVDYEVTIIYRTTKAYPGTQETPEEPEGFEIIDVVCNDLCNLKAIYNLDGEFAAEINDIVAAEHEDYEREE